MPTPPLPPPPVRSSAIPPPPPAPDPWATAERAPASAPQSPPRDRGHAGPSRISAAAEFLGYVGGLVTAVAAAYLAADWWDALGGLGQVGMLALGSAALGTAAAVVGDADDVARRLSTTLWWLASATSLATTYVLVERVARLGGEVAMLAAGLTAVGIAGPQWRRRRGVALHLPTYGGGLLAIAGASLTVTPATEPLAVALWAAGAAWAVLALAGIVTERRTGMALGAVTAMGAAQAIVFDATDAGLLLALLTTAALVALAVVHRDALLVTLAATAVLVFGPQLYTHWLSDVLTGSLVALVAGVAMLVACIWLIVRARADHA